MANPLGLVHCTYRQLCAPRVGLMRHRLLEAVLIFFAWFCYVINPTPFFWTDQNNTQKQQRRMMYRPRELQPASPYKQIFPPLSTFQNVK